jgi:hypothetical protein
MARAALLIFFVVAASLLAALPGSFAAPSKHSSPGKLFKAGEAAAVKSVEVQTEAPLPSDAPRLKMTGVGFEPFAFFQASFADSISAFDANCTTPKASWSLGDTVCVRVTGPLDASRVLRHVQLVNPDGFVIDSLDLTTNPQTLTFTLPSAPSVTLFGLNLDNRGTWRVNVTDTSDASVRAFVPVTVHDPAQVVADLQISKFITGNTQATAGSNVQSVIWVFNGGPDAAANVQFTDVPPANTTFQSLTQTDGPTFNCTTPAVDTPGTSVCTRSSLANGASAGFIVTYKVSASIANATELTSSANISSDTVERSASNNNSDESVNASNPSPPNCTITCPANITQDNDTGQAGAIVNYTAPSTAGTCGDSTTDHPSGSFFPIGTTIVTTNVADGSANGASCSFTVTVLDKRAVAVTLNGSADMTVECRTGFTDPGATATDNAPITTTIIVPSGQVDSNGDPINPTTVPAVDPNAPNTYTITYSATIGSNTATATRTVHVVDSTPPDITLTGTTGLTPQSTQVTVTNDDGTVSTITETIFVGTVECHTSFTPPTASATDGCDNHSVNVTTTGAADVNTPGVYEIVYAATDAAGNDTDRRVRITVVDTTPPVITLNGSTPMTVECHTSFADPGASASDGCEGPVAVTASGTVDPTTPGSYTIIYTATDGHNNTATKTRTVNVVDTTPPVITITGDNPATVECHTSYTDAGATANDACSGVRAVTVTANDVNANAPGTYHVAYSATDAAGNTATATRTVTVVDSTKPVITVVGANPYTVILGSSFTDPGATAADSCAGSVSVTATGTVNTNAVGTYTITYNATDPSGNSAVPATRTVNVIYNFTGFFSPVSNLPTINQANAGRSIPVKFSLGGNQGLSILAAGSPFSQQVTCGSSNVTDLQETGTAGSSSLSYDAGSNQYNYVWKTESAWAGTCRVLTVKLIDGTSHTANFKFK